MTTSSPHSQPFNVWINSEVLERFNMYAAEALIQHNSEIGGFIKIEESENDVFVTDVFIPKQSGSAASFEVSAQMDAEFLREMMKAGKLDEIPMWKGLIHSHPEGMGPSMSGVDVTAIQRRAEDSECFSLILSAKRSADSTRMAMHYCMKYRGKTLMFRDMKVETGWDGDRLLYAKEMAADIAAKLGASSSSSIKMVTDAVQNAICNLPPTFEDQRKQLRGQIAEEVKEKVDSRSWGRPSLGFSASRSTPWLPVANKHVGSHQEPVKTPLKPSRKADLDWANQADLEKAWKNVQRLYVIGYDQIDPENPDPSSFVTKKRARKSREIYRKTIIELNTALRELGGPGMGDIVLVNQEGVANNISSIDMSIEPTEVEDFSINNGLISYEVGGEIFWAEELEVVSTYEDIMDWNKEEVTA